MVTSGTQPQIKHVTPEVKTEMKKKTSVGNTLSNKECNW